MSSAQIGFALLALSAVAVGQTMGTGTIDGAITDATSAVVPAVKVTAIDLNTGIERSVLTNASGNYVIPALQIGKYHVKAVRAGFKVMTQEEVRLDVDTSPSVNLTLQVGTAEQSVTVNEAPPPLQTTSGEIGSIATGAQVSELSFNGRNFSQLLTLGTGVASQQIGRRMGVGQDDGGSKLPISDTAAVERERAAANAGAGRAVGGLRRQSRDTRGRNLQFEPAAADSGRCQRLT